MILTLAGKSCSGKDTVADLVADELRARGRSVVRMTFSDLLRAEARYGLEVMNQMHAEHSRPEVVDAIASVCNLAPEHADDFYGLLIDDVAACEDLTMRTRTPGTTEVLVRLGTDWRPEGHWVRRMLIDCLNAEAAGRDCIVVGNRYRLEHDLFAPHATSVRLDVSEAEQTRRMIARDGYAPDPDFLTSPGETEIDDAEFDIRLDTDHLDVEECADEVLGVLISDGEISHTRLNATKRITFGDPQ